MEDNQVQDKIIDEWTKKTKGAADGDRQEILNAMSRDMGVPRSVMAQHIAEWEASQSVGKVEKNAAR